MKDFFNQHKGIPQKNQMIILGSGTSTGTPISTCKCPVCTSPDPRDARLRSSVLITTRAGKNILIDVGPDFRAQSLLHQIPKIDGVIITHDHADHCHGIDDLRPYCFGPPLKTIPVYVNIQTAQNLSNRFPYIFRKSPLSPPKGGGIPQLTLEIVETSFEEVLICGERFAFFQLPHGDGFSLGIYHQKMAYLIDCHQVPSTVIDRLVQMGVELLIIDCARNVPHATHLHWDLSIEYFQKIAPTRCGLGHLSHDFFHQRLWNQCQEFAPLRLFPLADGMMLTY